MYQLLLLLLSVCKEQIYRTYFLRQEVAKNSQRPFQSSFGTVPWFGVSFLVLRTLALLDPFGEG